MIESFEVLHLMFVKRLFRKLEMKSVTVSDARKSRSVSHVFLDWLFWIPIFQRFTQQTTPKNEQY